MATRKNSRAANGLRVGSRVVYQTPYARYEAEVIEDRGNIGVNGRRLMRILTFDDYPEARLDLEVPAQDLLMAE